MKISIYSRHRIHPDIIRKTIWLYFRFNLIFRDIEEMLAERGIDVSYETIRRWVGKFGLTYARKIKRGADKPSAIWHSDEAFVKIDGTLVYLWRAVDDEGTVLDVVVQTHRNRKSALRLITKLLKNQSVRPERIVTGKLKSYGAALREIGPSDLQNVRGRNNRAKCSHVPTRRPSSKMRIFSSADSACRVYV